MPKKPFTPEEVNAQRERIMDSASTVMADVGFHHLSMRKLATQLGMTASNIYNYFPDKETLFINSRRRGFELFFALPDSDARSATEALHDFAASIVEFAQKFPGYYQLMFQPPLLSLDHEKHDQAAQLQVDRLLEEWQRHAMSLVVDAMPSLAEQPEAVRSQLALFFVASIHGLVDSYHYRSLPLLLDGVDLIAGDVLEDQINWLLELVQQKASTLSNVAS